MKLPKTIRTFNKHFINRLTGKIARSSWGPFCLIYHTGRRSGKRYQTPIIAIPTTDSFIVALTYGPDVDWYRNVAAAGTCKILWHGREYPIEKQEKLDIKSAQVYFPWFERLILELMGTQDFIQLCFHS